MFEHVKYLLVRTSMFEAALYTLCAYPIGMEHAGIGPTHVNNFITALNIPALDPKLLRPRVTKTASVVQKLVHFLEMPADGGSNSKAASSQPLLSAATSSQSEISAATSSQPEVSAATTSQPELSAERLALFEKRRANGYDIPDPAYLAWLAVQV